MNQRKIFAALACTCLATAASVAKATDRDASDYGTTLAVVRAALLYLQDGGKDSRYSGKTPQNGAVANALTESKFWLATDFFFLPKTQAMVALGSDIAASNGFKDSS